MDQKGQISNTFRSDLKRLIRYIYKFKPYFFREEINVLRFFPHWRA